MQGLTPTGDAGPMGGTVPGEAKPPGAPVEFAAIQNQEDAPPCPTCGSIMVRSGACYKCANCGTTSGCA
jgi:ribonucleoside-diphosphate reductase alpha chain